MLRQLTVKFELLAMNYLIMLLHDRAKDPRTGAFNLPSLDTTSSLGSGSQALHEGQLWLPASQPPNFVRVLHMDLYSTKARPRFLSLFLQVLLSMCFLMASGP